MFMRYPRYSREMILLTRVLLCRWGLRILHKGILSWEELGVALSLYHFTFRYFARRNIFAILCIVIPLCQLDENMHKFLAIFFFTRECYPIYMFYNRFLRFFLKFKSVYLCSYRRFRRFIALTLNLVFINMIIECYWIVNEEFSKISL